MVFAITRRHLLALAAAYAALPRATLVFETDVSNLGPASPALAVLGRSYLAAYPDEGDAEKLLRGIAGNRAQPCSRAAWCDLIRERRADEFAHADTVIVDGWILARCEARLCALQAIG